MRPHPRRLLAGALTAVVVTTALSAHAATAAPTRPAGPQLAVYRVPGAAGAADALLQRGFDVLERRTGDDLYVLGGAGTSGALRAAGFAAGAAQPLAPLTWAVPSTRLVPGAAGSLTAPVDETYDGGYHTVKAQQAHLDLIAANHPDLATVVDYGDSYLKTVNAATGYDLKAICLTRRQAGDCALNPNSVKPRFLLMTQIHAREIATGDFSWRIIDHLANDYATDTTVSALLDGTEVWVVPVVNPDGTDKVQQGGNAPYLQRKNMHGSGCANPPTASRQFGVDLNRNTNSHWNTTGVSSSLCAQTYPGTRADSEPESTAIEQLFKSLFADQRGTGNSTPAPANTRGAMITMHSDAGMNLFPWGYGTTHTGNDAKLRAIARTMSSFNGYSYGQPGEILYNASGTSDDWAYDQLGIASFTIELDSCGSFTPSYTCMPGSYSKNLPAVMYVASLAHAPYA